MFPTSAGPRRPPHVVADGALASCLVDGPLGEHHDGAVPVTHVRHTVRTRPVQLVTGRSVESPTRRIPTPVLRGSGSRANVAPLLRGPLFAGHLGNRRRNFKDRAAPAQRNAGRTRTWSVDRRQPVPRRHRGTAVRRANHCPSSCPQLRSDCRLGSRLLGMRLQPAGVREREIRASIPVGLKPGPAQERPRNGSPAALARDADNLRTRTGSSPPARWLAIHGQLLAEPGDLFRIPGSACMAGCWGRLRFSPAAARRPRSRWVPGPLPFNIAPSPRSPR